MITKRGTTTILPDGRVLCEGFHISFSDDHELEMVEDGIKQLKVAARAIQKKHRWFRW